MLLQHQRKRRPRGSQQSPHGQPAKAPGLQSCHLVGCGAHFLGQVGSQGRPACGSTDSGKGRAVSSRSSRRPCGVFCSQTSSPRSPSACQALSPVFCFGTGTGASPWRPNPLGKVPRPQGPYIIGEGHTQFKVYKKRKCFALAVFPLAQVVCSSVILEKGLFWLVHVLIKRMFLYHT